MGFQPAGVLELLEKYYPRLKVEGISMKGGSNLAFIRGRGKNLVFKRHSPLASPNHASLEAVYARCAEVGLIPGLIPSKGGRLLVKHGDALLSLQEEGGREPREVNPEALGRRVARLHQVLSSARISHLYNHFQKAVPDIKGAAKKYGYAYLVPILEQGEETFRARPRQVIHGDLHVQNILHKGNEILFIDLDSACLSIPIIDVAFSAYRVFGLREEKIKAYVGAYNRTSPGREIGYEDLWRGLLYCIIQRICFLLHEREKGIFEWIWDLKHQRRYLQEVLRVMALKEEKGNAALGM